MRRVIFVMALALICTDLRAGSRGFVAAMIDIGDDRFFESAVYTTYRDAEISVSDRSQMCWNRSATGGEHLDWIIRKNIPDGISSDLAKAAWQGDSAAAERIRKILKSSRSPDGRSEIDGIYVINTGAGTISIMAIGSRPPIGKSNPSKKVSISWNENSPTNGAMDLDWALCSVSRPLSFGFNP